MSCITTKPNVSLSMRLTLHADYSLRVLMFAGLKGSELSTITKIAEHFEISRSHLMKVVHDLGRLGYIETVQGKNGGFRLMRKPSQIIVGAVVRDTEEELARHRLSAAKRLLQNRRRMCIAPRPPVSNVRIDPSEGLGTMIETACRTR